MLKDLPAELLLKLLSRPMSVVRNLLKLMQNYQKLHMVVIYYMGF